jgi:hypothetical protein
LSDAISINKHISSVDDNSDCNALDKLSVDGKINYTMDFREIRVQSVDWAHLAQNGDERWVLVNMVMKIHIP